MLKFLTNTATILQTFIILDHENFGYKSPWDEVNLEEDPISFFF